MALLVIAVYPVAAQQLLDRIVARVNGEPITLTDVRAAVALGVIDVPPGADDAVATQQMIDRQLVLAEVARFAPPEPPAADVTREATALAAHVGSRLAAVMDATGIDEGRIREIARDNLRVRAYLNQRFGVTTQLSEEEVLQYYRIHPEEFTRDATLIPFTQAEPLARERAGAERRALTVAQWRQDLRSRASITLPISPPATLPPR